VTASLRRLEIAVAVSLLLLGAFATWAAAEMPFGTAAMPGPGMMPMALGLLLMLSAAGLIVLELRGPATDAAVVLGNRHVALGIALIIVAGLLFERVGFIVTSTLFLFVMLASLSPLSLALMGHLVAKEDLSRANGFYNGCYALGMLVGPALSSLLFKKVSGAAMLFHLAGMWAFFVAFCIVFRSDDRSSTERVAITV